MQQRSIDRKPPQLITDLVAISLFERDMCISERMREPWTSGTSADSETDVFSEQLLQTFKGKHHYHDDINHIFHLVLL